MQTRNPNTGVTRREILLGLLGGAAASASRSLLAVQNPAATELALCGAEEVLIMSVTADAESTPRKIWSWRAAECPDIPQSLQPAFRSTDDCKPIEGGQRILVSSSSGAVAVVERASRRAPFFAPVVNAHSIELLPGGKIVAAASVSDSAAGNRIVVFDVATRQEIASDGLVSAHGLVWDESRRLLWALGNDQLRAYRWTESTSRRGSLKAEIETKLPDSGGHDLSPVPGTPLLFVSTGRRSWLFNRDTHRLEPHDLLADAANVKSYSVHPVTGRIAYVQAEGGNWWAERVRFLKPPGVLHSPGQRLYKARWV